ncbi:hypothetical protein H6G97_00705 [Nostoc flagelliforme FACHB-838]|uniref:Transposase n=1 Tax=Nostoc flagelliforme FACHB-838 TaxID=2692904 RepID=A0ABR8DH41_9NOSO|nr:hypothetical protein [Nostoc flagelliforme]MBD2528155.1 hypothetical protein [Nostoc flagelliforme FACHB-838]
MITNFSSKAIALPISLPGWLIAVISENLYCLRQEILMEIVCDRNALPLPSR